jgi:hypothetical protein
MVNSKRSKHSVYNKINRSRRYIMKGGDPSQRMLGNVLTLLELQFPETYKRAEGTHRWFDWKRQLGWKA